MNIREFVKLPAAKLQRIVAMKREIERLEARLEKLIGAAAPEAIESGTKKKRTMSAAGRRRISQAAKARWAKVKAGTGAGIGSPQKAVKKKRTMSAAARKKISLAAKARWAKVRAARAK